MHRIKLSKLVSKYWLKFINQKGIQEVIIDWFTSINYLPLNDPLRLYYSIGISSENMVQALKCMEQEGNCVQAIIEGIAELEGVQSQQISALKQKIDNLSLKIKTQNQAIQSQGQIGLELGLAIQSVLQTNQPPTQTILSIKQALLKIQDQDQQIQAASHNNNDLIQSILLKDQAIQLQEHRIQAEIQEIQDNRRRVLSQGPAMNQTLRNQIQILLKLVQVKDRIIKIRLFIMQSLENLLLELEKVIKARELIIYGLEYIKSQLKQESIPHKKVFSQKLQKQKTQ